MKKVICWGTFDTLHKGHEDFLKDAKKQGDYLIVIIPSDKAVYMNKGRYPKNNQEKRIENLKEKRIVDEVIKAEDDFNSNLELIRKIAPDVFVLGYDQKTEIEQELRNYFNSQKMSCKFYISKKFAEGIHSSHLK